jgi:hypothetical protein
MTARKLVTFEDIYTAICETVKIQLSDGVTLERVKRYINMAYIDELMPYKPRAWWWAHLNDNITTVRKVTTGTVSATVGSTTCTFSSAPATSQTGKLIKFTAYPEVYRIAAHTGGATSFTLEEEFIAESIADATAVTGASYKIWQDRYSIDANMVEVIQVKHNKRSEPLAAYNIAEFDAYVQNHPEMEGAPSIYAIGDFDPSGDRYIYFYPSCSDRPVHVKILGLEEVDELDGDDDEPAIPVMDRIVLYYGGLWMTYEQQRNETESAKNYNLFMKKMDRMAARSGEAPIKTTVEVDRNYLYEKRYSRWVGPMQRRKWESD